MEKFIQALKNNSLSEVESIPKSDLHNHAGRGGRISYIENMLNVKLSPLSKVLSSVQEMDRWFADNVKCHFPDKSGFIPRIAAAFVQAKADNVSVLALNYGVNEVYWLGGMDIFTAIMNGLHKAFAPEATFLPDLFLWKTDNINKLDEIFSENWFKGIEV